MTFTFEFDLTFAGEPVGKTYRVKIDADNESNARVKLEEEIRNKVGSARVVSDSENFLEHLKRTLGI